MKDVLALTGLMTLFACTPPSDPGSGRESVFPGLAGRWRSSEDPSWALELTGVCCGSKPKLQGAISHGDQRMGLKPLSYANVYPIVKPDSASVPEYAMAVVLAAEGNVICAVEGAVEDNAGGRLFPNPVMPDSAVLALTFTSATATGCDSAWATMAFVKEP